MYTKRGRDQSVLENMTEKLLLPTGIEPICAHKSYPIKLEVSQVCYVAVITTHCGSSM